MKFITSIAMSAGKKRLANRKAGFERAADKAGINAEFHLCTNVERISPWPPADVLALLPKTDIADAVLTLDENAELLRSLVGPSNRLTIMPLIDGVALPALATSGHQTLLPDVDGAIVWVEYLGLRYAPSKAADLFGEVLRLSSELGAMEQKGLGNELRPEHEVFVRRSLSSTFTTKNKELTRLLQAFDSDLRNKVSDLIEDLRTGDIDFAAEAASAIGGASTETVEQVRILTMILIESEWQAGNSVVQPNNPNITKPAQAGDLLEL